MTPRPSTTDLVQRAKLLLQSTTASDPATLLGLAKQLKGGNAFDYARRLLARAAGASIADEHLRVKVTQQWALCTYKDPDLAAPQRLLSAFEILRSVIPRAEETWVRHASEPPADPTEIANVRDAQETFGIAGAIHKRRWQIEAQPGFLVESYESYAKGFDLGPAHDDGYTGVNAAFVLDLLARQDEIHTSGNPKTRELIQVRRDEARRIRARVVDQVAPLAATAEGQEVWWRATTLCEAFLGLGDVPKAVEWARIARACRTKLAGTDREVQKWEEETTARQLADLTRLQPDDTAGRWTVLGELLGPEHAGGLESMFAGKVGLALSGGGFRASLFHLGVLARLAELDLLRHVEVLSCVSGGSIVGAHYYLVLRNLLLTTAAPSRDDYVALVTKLTADFLAAVQRNPRMQALANPRQLPALLRNGRTMRMADVLEQGLYEPASGTPGVTVSGLYIRPAGAPADFNPKYDNWRCAAKVPILLLNATSLNTGHNWQFSASWMGESPASIDVGVDANERLRRLYYDDEDTPPAHRAVRLAVAVAASACVPGLFDPVQLRDLYPDRTVELVDGGVHDNQGIAGLLEQECTTIIVSDASGQTGSEPAPARHALASLMRSNDILMARVREAEHRELEARRRSGALRALVFLHLKKDLAVEPVSWIGCDDPKADTFEGGVPIRSTAHTRYGVRADLQALLAGIRTDLDAFSDIEALALMASGYRMAKYELERCPTGFAAPPASPAPWTFLAADPVVTAPTASAIARLQVAAYLFFKALRLGAWWPKVTSVARGAPGVVALVVLFFVVRRLGWTLVYAAAVFAVAVYAGLAALHWRSTRLDQRYLRGGKLS